jgi:chemotaxis protein CheD
VTDADRAQQPGRADVYLPPGQVVVASAPTAITTVLGSSVAVCLWDHRWHVGGMSHYLLPHEVGEAGTSPRFGAVAIHQLIVRVAALGSVPRDLCAMVFGGAWVLETPRRAGDLGDKNTRRAFAQLAEARIPVIGHDVGGRWARQLVFQTDDGTARVQLVQ